MIIDFPLRNQQVIEISKLKKPGRFELISDDGMSTVAIEFDKADAEKLIAALKQAVVEPAEPLNSGDLIGAMMRDGAGS